MKTIHVAVAVIENPDNFLLIARRPAHLHMGGLWEFPGGKVEAGETVLHALQREIREEIALEIHAAQPMLQIPFQYPDKRVLLDVWRVTQFSGEARGCEGQEVCWVSRSELVSYPFPAANRAILAALQLPERLLVTGDFSDTADCLQRTKDAIEHHGLHAVMLRAPHLAPVAYAQLAADMFQLCQRLGVSLYLNADANSNRETADGLHLTASRLLACRERPVNEKKLFGASCHNVEEIRHAIAVGVDYITLSPVLPTSSHPDALSLGWDGLAELLAICSMPVFALGGVDDRHLAQAKLAGAFGIAGISAWW
jgi:8-oxo-dGTP diphosphatase